MDALSKRIWASRSSWRVDAVSAGSVGQPLGLRHRPAAFALAADAALPGAADAGAARLSRGRLAPARVRVRDGLARAGLLARVLTRVAERSALVRRRDLRLPLA